MPEAARVTTCACGTELAPTLLACPQCHRLVHAGQLRALAAEAERATAAGDVTGALSAWRRALDLLPEGTRQHAQIRETVNALSARVGAGGGAPAQRHRGTPKGLLAGLGALGLLLWKLKFVVIFLASKAKLLLLGLTKASTFISMALAFGVYWSLWGWKFALGFILVMYVHEMGHVVTLRAYGIAATAPMFIPGLGAFVRLKQYPANPIEDARSGLAGPLWGLAASAASLALGLALESALLIAVARVGGWLNLFNLIPLGSLDGGRGFRSLSRRQRWWATGGLVLTYALSNEGFAFLIAIVAGARAMSPNAPVEGDRRGLVYYVLLALGCGLLAAVPVAVSP